MVQSIFGENEILSKNELFICAWVEGLQKTKIDTRWRSKKIVYNLHATEMSHYVMAFVIRLTSVGIHL